MNLLPSLVMRANTPSNSSIIQKSRNREASRHVFPTMDQKSNKSSRLSWKAANQICTKRLTPFLPTLVEALERHGHLYLTEECRNQLLSISATTADRLLRNSRQQHPHGVSTTRAGTLLKNQIPIRTFQDWDKAQPGFLEADLVAHCGIQAEGGYLYTLTLTHGHCDGLDRMPPASLPQPGNAAGGLSTRTYALAFSHFRHRYR